MNTIIFRDSKEALALPKSDPRAVHLKEVVNVKDGDLVFVGIAGGKLGKTRVYESKEEFVFSPHWEDLENPELLDITLAVAYARPQIAKRILFEAACMGVKNLCFYASEKSTASYAKSSLYVNKEYEEHFYAGLSQACATSMPEFSHFDSLEDFLQSSKARSQELKIAPDLYEASCKISESFKHKGMYKSAAVVLGSERGFSNLQRESLRKNGFTLVSMGKRVLRTDTAVIATLAYISEYL